MKFQTLYRMVCLLVFCHASAQETWDLKKCLDTGMANNLDFQMAQLDIASAETTHRSVAMEFLPTANIGTAHNYSIGSTIDPATNSRVSSNIQSDDFSLNSSMDLINFNHFTTARRNKIAVLKAKADKEALASEYALVLLENYFNVIYSQAQLKVQQSQFENAVFNLNRIKKEVEIGSKPASDWYDIQVSYAREENALATTSQLLFNQKLKLLQLINVTGVSPDDIVLAAVVAVDDLAAVNLYAVALEHNPKISAATLDIAISSRNVTIERNQFLPVVSATYSYSSFYYLPLSQPNGNLVDPFWTQFNNNKNHFISLRLGIPIFNGFKTRRDVQLSRIEYQKSKVAAEQEKIKLQQAIAEESAKRSQQIELVKLLENTRDFAQKSFETTQAKFTSGRADAFTFTASKNLLLTTEYDLLKAQFTADYLALKLHFLAKNSFY